MLQFRVHAFYIWEDDSLSESFLFSQLKLESVPSFFWLSQAVLCLTFFSLLLLLFVWGL